jgi:hypothetical protein
MAVGRVVCCAIFCGSCIVSVARAQVDHTTLQNLGLEVQQEIERSLRVPNTQLYAETASLQGTQSGGINGRAFVWPASTQFRILNSLVQIDPGKYTSTLRQFSDQLHAAYWNAGYRSGAGAGDRFYDDNAHVVVALAEAYFLTNDPVYLDRAKATQAFVLQGEDNAAGGGIYFQQNNFHSKDAISTLQGARGAALLYRATGEQQYLEDATRLLTWANSHIQRPNGLFYQGYVIATNSPSGVEIVNSAGVGISANLALFDATDEQSYLTEAQRIAGASIPRYFDGATGRINDEGYWAYELVDALNGLYLRDKNPLWLNRTKRALDWLHDNKRDPNGHYGLFWGRNGAQVGALSTWNLNEQAAVARAYLSTSTTLLPGDVNQDGSLTAADIDAFVAGWRSDTSDLTQAARLRAGDLNLDGSTNLADFVLLRNALNQAGVAIPASAVRAIESLPEPGAMLLWLTGSSIAAASVRPLRMPTSTN